MATIQEVNTSIMFGDFTNEQLEDRKSTRLNSSH